MKKRTTFSSIAPNEGAILNNDSHFTPPDNLSLENNFEYDGDNVDGEMFGEPLYPAIDNDTEEYKRFDKANEQDFSEYSDVFEALS